MSKQRGDIMKVFLLKDIEKVGMAGEIIKVTEGHARNFLVPRKLALIVTPENEKQYLTRVKTVEHRQEVISSKTSILAERIKALTITLKRKTHDGEKLYAAVSAGEIADLLGLQGISVNKSQILHDKAIKTQGKHEVTVKLTSKLQPVFTLTVLSE